MKETWKILTTVKNVKKSDLPIIQELAPNRKIPLNTDVNIEYVIDVDYLGKVVQRFKALRSLNTPIVVESSDGVKPLLLELLEML